MRLTVTQEMTHTEPGMWGTCQLWEACLEELGAVHIVYLELDEG